MESQDERTHRTRRLSNLHQYLLLHGIFSPIETEEDVKICRREKDPISGMTYQQIKEYKKKWIYT